MMYRILVLFIFMLVGCSATGNVVVSSAVEQAVKESDFRLYVTAGRRPTLPGLELMAVEKLKKRCGLRYMEGVSDVVRDMPELHQRKEKLVYMAEFNRQMIKQCPQ